MPEQSARGKLAWAIRGLSVLLLLLAPETGDTGFALLLLGLCIPHGAADHLIFRSRQPAGVGGSDIRFAIFYLVVIVAYGLLWFILPGAALLAFLVVSVYHFGQSYPGNAGNQLLWGTFVLGFPVLLHYGDAQPIVEGMLHRRLFLPNWVSWLVPTLLLLANLLVGYLSKQWTRILDACILAIIYLHTDLLLGFAAYFLIWHSLPAAVDQWRYLQRHLLTDRLGMYLRQLLPLTLGAVVSLGLIYWLLNRQGPEVPYLSQLFILVSLITLPHAFLVDRVYRG